MSSLEKAIKIAISAKSLIFLTGAGVSVASGLPTYRGKGGLWTRKSPGQNPYRTATKAYFEMNPYECWEKSYNFYNLMMENKPNVCHYAILDMQKTCFNKGIDMTLVTQNIDGYHADVIREAKLFGNTEVPEGTPSYGRTKGVYEIHGNHRYMKCDTSFCTNRNLYKVPPVYNSYKIPRCEVCGNIMRINTLLFDETYNEMYFSSETVLEKSKKSYLLIIAGTELKTGLPKKLLYEHIDRNKYVIEFNLRSWILDYPNQVLIEGPCEKTIPMFVKDYIAAIK